MWNLDSKCLVELLVKTISFKLEYDLFAAKQIRVTVIAVKIYNYNWEKLTCPNFDDVDVGDADFTRRPYANGHLKNHRQ